MPDDSGFYKVVFKKHSSFAGDGKEGYVSVIIFNSCKKHGLKIHVYEKPNYDKILGEFFIEELEVVQN